MNKKKIKKFAEEEFINNTMKHLDSALIFSYIQNLEKESQQLKKQKDDVVEYIKEAMYSDSFTELPSGEITDISYCIPAFKDILRMLGEIDIED